MAGKIHADEVDADTGARSEPRNDEGLEREREQLYVHIPVQPNGGRTVAGNRSGDAFGLGELQDSGCPRQLDYDVLIRGVRYVHRSIPAVRRRRLGARYDYWPGVYERCMELQLIGRV